MKIVHLIMASIFAAGSLSVAIWMIWNTHVSFPNEPFFELVPGYIVFPLIVVLLGAMGVIECLFA